MESMTAVVPQRYLILFSAAMATLDASKRTAISLGKAPHDIEHQIPDDDHLRNHCGGWREGFT
jgi:7-cyano-7-deazaguanine synthase in queuosine biosynthesis